jgi:uncharacterized protein YhhL (DUF1145 family)
MEKNLKLSRSQMETIGIAILLNICIRYKKMLHWITQAMSCELSLMSTIYKEIYINY